MKKQQLSTEQKRLETDIWIIALVTLGVFLFYVATGKQLMSIVANSNISVIPRLLLNAGVQFGVGEIFAATRTGFLVLKNTVSADNTVAPRKMRGDGETSDTILV